MGQNTPRKHPSCVLRCAESQPVTILPPPLPQQDVNTSVRWSLCWEKPPPMVEKSARTEGAGAWSSGWHYRFTWGGGGIFLPKPPVFDRSWRSPSKNTVKNSTEDTCSWTRPSKIGKRKVKKPCVFQLFDLNFLACNIFFCGSAGGRARRRIFEFLDPFSDWFSSFCDSRNTGFYSVFLFSACLTASFKTSKNLVNYAVLCYGVNENIVNTSVFWRWLKKHCKLQCFWPPDPRKPWYLQWFLLLTAQKHCK